MLHRSLKSVPIQNILHFSDHITNEALKLFQGISDVQYSKDIIHSPVFVVAIIHVEGYDPESWPYQH